MKISIELTSEQVEWAKRHAQQCQFATPSAHASIVVGLANG